MSTPATITSINTHITGKLQALEADLNAVLIERQEAVRVALVGLVSGQHVFLLGERGIGKSFTVTEIKRRVVGAAIFKKLLTKFTTDNEIFGPIDMAQWKTTGDYRRKLARYLPDAHLAFLDETFKANSSILNALLTIMNEGEFDDDGHTIQCPLLCLFGASNELPQDDNLTALWDRFSLRLKVEPVSKAGRRELRERVAARAFGAPGVTLDLQDLLDAQEAARNLPVPDSVLDALDKLDDTLAQKGIVYSDRRAGWIIGLLQAHALLEGRDTVDEEDLVILEHALWDEPKDRAEIARILATTVSPLLGQAKSLADKAASVYQTWKSEHASATGKAQSEVDAEAHDKLKKIGQEMRGVQREAAASGKNTVQIDRLLQAVTEQFKEVASILVSF